MSTAGAVGLFWEEGLPPSARVEEQTEATLFNSDDPASQLTAAEDSSLCTCIQVAVVVFWGYLVQGRH